MTGVFESTEGGGKSHQYTVIKLSMLSKEETLVESRSIRWGQNWIEQTIKNGRNWKLNWIIEEKGNV